MFDCHQMFLKVPLEIEKAACFSKVSEVSSRILGKITKTMVFALKLGYCNNSLQTNANCVFIRHNFDWLSKTFLKKPSKHWFVQ